MDSHCSFIVDSAMSQILRSTERISSDI